MSNCTVNVTVKKSQQPENEREWKQQETEQFLRPTWQELPRLQVSKVQRRRWGSNGAFLLTRLRQQWCQSRESLAWLSTLL